MFDRTRIGPRLILALDVMVGFRGRRLGDVDRVGAREGLLQPLLQRLIEPALLGAFRRPWGRRVVRSWTSSLAPISRSDFAVGPSMLDETSRQQIQEGPGTSMKHITCIEDLRQLHKRRVPKAFFDYADRGSYSEDTLRANRDDLAADQVPPAHPGRCLEARSLHHDPRRARGDAADPGAGRIAGHAAWRRRNRRLPRRAGRRHSRSR